MLHDYDVDDNDGESSILDDDFDDWRRGIFPFILQKVDAPTKSSKCNIMFHALQIYEVRYLEKKSHMKLDSKLTTTKKVYTQPKWQPKIFFPFNVRTIKKIIGTKFYIIGER